MERAVDLSVRRDGIEITARDHGGDGRPLIALGGIGSNLEAWDGWVPVLGPAYRIVAVDPRAAGASTPVDDWTLEDAVDDVDHIAGHLALDDPLILGHSLGGVIATAAVTRGGYAAAINIDGHTDPIEMAEMIELLAAHDAEEVGDDAWRTAEIDAARARVEAAGGAWDQMEAFTRRRFSRLPDGRYTLNPSTRAKLAIVTSLLDVDSVALTERARAPMLVFDLNGAITSDPDSREAIFKRELGPRLAALAEERPHVRVATIAAPHSIGESRPAIVERIRAFVDAL